MFGRLRGALLGASVTVALAGSVGTLVVTSGCVEDSCGGECELSQEESTSGTAGETGLGGANSAGGIQNGSGGDQAPCTHSEPCGGDVVGTWTATSSCLKVNGQLDLSPVGIGCSTASITGGDLLVTGIWVARPDGSFSDHTTTTGDEQFRLAPECIDRASVILECDALDEPLSATLGYSSVACTEADDGGCNCAATVQQHGGMGLPSALPTVDGTYTTSNDVVTALGDTETPYSYCVSGNTMTMTPQSSMPTTTGTIVLAR